jgi:cell filamentation protein
MQLFVFMGDENKKKYSTSGDEKETDVLPNLLNYSTIEEIEDAELEGFYIAQNFFIDKLSDKTKFTNRLLYKIHKVAFGHLYPFAGKLRTVNISKNGFLFPSAMALPNAMLEFEKSFLAPLNKDFNSKKELIVAIAKAHAELLYIHPFREGNGRTARLLAYLVYLSKTGDLLHFSNVLSLKKERYISAVQQAASLQYSMMVELFEEMITVQE